MMPRPLPRSRLGNLIPTLVESQALVALVPATGDLRWSAQAAWDVARAAVHQDRRVALVDLWIDEPRLHEVVGYTPSDGIVDAFEYGVSLTRTAHEVDGVFFIAAGSYTASAGEIFGHARWKKLHAGFRSEGALLLLYLSAGGLARLAATPDGLIVLSPDGFEPESSDRPGNHCRDRAGCADAWRRARALDPGPGSRRLRSRSSRIGPVRPRATTAPARPPAASGPTGPRCGDARGGCGRRLGGAVARHRATPPIAAGRASPPAGSTPDSSRSTARRHPRLDRSAGRVRDPRQGARAGGPGERGRRRRGGKLRHPRPAGQRHGMVPCACSARIRRATRPPPLGMRSGTVAWSRQGKESCCAHPTRSRSPTPWISTACGGTASPPCREPGARRRWSARSSPPNKPVRRRPSWSGPAFRPHSSRGWKRHHETEPAGAVGIQVVRGVGRAAVRRRRHLHRGAERLRQVEHLGRGALGVGRAIAPPAARRQDGGRDLSRAPPAAGR